MGIDYLRLTLRGLLEGEFNHHPWVARVRRGVHLAGWFVALTFLVVSSCAPHVPAHNMRQDAPSAWLVTGAEVPGKPFEGQAMAPCAAWETTINGGCWGELAVKPGKDGCPAGLYEHAGKCFLPLKKAPPVPRSATP